MLEQSIYQDIAVRTGGDIYIGIVGPVRTGKSTLIKKFMEHLILPNIEGEYVKERAKDEMPQSGSGRTVMTTEPKFIPEEAAKVKLDDNTSFRVKLIDCVGYVIPGAIGHIEEGQPRMVMTPWSEEPLPFEEAAELGTQKVIREHSTLGIVVTTDGTIGDLPRESYIESEERVINELKELNKPFAIVLNSSRPNAPQTIALCKDMEAQYGVSVIPLNCIDLGENEIKEILKTVLYEFPVQEIRIQMPSWLNIPGETNVLFWKLLDTITSSVQNIDKIGKAKKAFESFSMEDGTICSVINGVHLGEGCANVEIRIPEKIFYKMLGERCGYEIQDEKQLMELLTELSAIKKKYDKVSVAIDDVMETGYGIVMPTVEDMRLEEPEIVKQPGGYGVKLKASAPSIHMMKAEIQTEVSPMVGTESQSEELVKFLLKEFESDPKAIWDSNMFGKTLHELVSEGLTGKLSHMPKEARDKITGTIQRIINEGSGGLICILL